MLELATKLAEYLQLDRAICLNPEVPWYAQHYQLGCGNNYLLYATAYHNSGYQQDFAEFEKDDGDHKKVNYTLWARHDADIEEKFTRFVEAGFICSGD